MENEWNITWDCLIESTRGGGGECSSDCDYEVRMSVCAYLHFKFDVDVDYDTLKIRKYGKYVNCKYNIDQGVAKTN
tara:strand:- start:1366 stop:1593 length:228 start_codon:yes stop_codon:yes gene_type:complete